jgi:hypothetical protein
MLAHCFGVALSNSPSLDSGQRTPNSLQDKVKSSLLALATVSQRSRSVFRNRDPREWPSEKLYLFLVAARHMPKFARPGQSGYGFCHRTKTDTRRYGFYLASGCNRRSPSARSARIGTRFWCQGDEELRARNELYGELTLLFTFVLIMGSKNIRLISSVSVGYFLFRRQACT